MAAVAVVAAWSCPPLEAAAHGTDRVVDGRVDDWRGSTTGLGGTWQYSRGELVYQDYLYDDLGAETRQRAEQHGNVTGAPMGDYRYPNDAERYGHNAADFLELRLAADARSLWVLARMNTLKARDTTVVAVAFDTDGRASTGGGAWPYGAGLSVQGVDRVVTLWGSAGSVTNLHNGKVAALRDAAVDIGNDSNALEARIPRSLLGAGSKLRVWAVAGLWDTRTSRWMAGQIGPASESTPGGSSPAVAARAFNVAFRPDETGSFMEERQAQALAAGDIEPFHATIDLDLLTAGRSRPYRIQPGRFYAAIMDQHFTIPPDDEGVSYVGVPGRFAGIGGAVLSQTFEYFGSHQPYGLYVPSTYGKSDRIPAAFALHGHGGSYSSYNSQPGFLRDMGEGDGTPRQPPMFLITPLARGSSFYADWGEADTFAVLRDVHRRFGIDDSRLYLTGYSMGGYGVYRLASLHPDLFAAAAVWAGYTGEFVGTYLTSPSTVVEDPTGEVDPISAELRDAVAPLGVGGGRQGKAAIGNPVDTLENLRHLPLVHLAGSNDEVVPTTGQYAAPRRLAELGYRSRFDLFPGYEHLTFAIVDDWKGVREWLGDQRRATAPRDITYTFSDGWTAPGLSRSLGLRHGTAWWLRDASMRTPTSDALSLASVTAVSHGIRDRARDVREEVGVALRPTPHFRQLVSWEPGALLPTRNRLELRLSGVGVVRIDLARAGLGLCGLSVHLTSDGPATVHLAGAAVAGAVVRGHRDVTSRTDAGGLAVGIRRAVASRLTVRC